MEKSIQETIARQKEAMSPASPLNAAVSFIWLFLLLSRFCSRGETNMVLKEPADVATAALRGKAGLHRLFLARDGFPGSTFSIRRVWFDAAIGERLYVLSDDS